MKTILIKMFFGVVKNRKGIIFAASNRKKAR
jgi:hypothetical protein